MEQRPPRVPKVAWLIEEEESPGDSSSEELEEVVPFQPVQKGWKKDEKDIEQRPSRVPKLAWGNEKEESPGAASAQETEHLVPFQPLQQGAAMDRTQEQDPTRGRFRRTAQLICKLLKSIRREGASTGVIAYSDIFKQKITVSLLDMLVKNGVSSPDQVPAMVRFIHQWLMANESTEHRVERILLDITKAQPTDVVMTLLRVAPWCDRAAMTMWTTIMSSLKIAEEVQQILLDVLGSWPEHSTCTSDGDTTRVLSLAATVVIWKILQVSCVPHVLILFFPRLFVHLLFQAYFSTLDTPEEVDKFWKRCQEQHSLTATPNRFAVQTLKSLLCLLQCEHVVISMERKCGWDTLLCADTHHYAVGLLARELRSASMHLCKSILCCLLEMLSKEMPYWDFPALAFLVEVLEYLDLSECSDNIMDVLSRHLNSEHAEIRRQVLRALLLLRDDPSLTKRMWNLTEGLVELLQDDDSDVVRMTIILISYLFLDNGTSIPSPIALQLAEVLLPLFGNDDSQVQLLSMFVFRTLMNFVGEEGKKALKTYMRQSLLPLFFHCHDENSHVAEAARTALLSVAKFLKRQDLENHVKKDKLWKFADCLLAEDEERIANYLRQALRYLRSPQEPLREAAVRFIGMAGRSLRGHREDLQVLCRAIEHLTEDISCAVSDLALQTLCVLRALQSGRYSIFQRLQDQFHRAWRIRHRLSGLSWLRCWRSAES
ncbi:maestro heat-like repeat-containing protein family member 6 [Oenanthe melanoleuca]|uniref:maestro heat-like repeat-containing protein family member 6 n=1 Tax=Oenanthe melanoleuca TaxID=2939378 RepID=UPI0024C1633A|nr:maestro heat-like repeat-containing protein family member 6 [Oenanthe melanoleuca]